MREEKMSPEQLFTSAAQLDSCVHHDRTTRGSSTQNLSGPSRHRVFVTARQAISDDSEAA